MKRHPLRLRGVCSRLLHHAIQRLCFIAVVLADDRKLAARYRRRYAVSIDAYRWDVRQLRRYLAKLDALLWCNFRRYEYLCSLHFDD